MIKQYFETLMNTLFDEKHQLEKKNTDMENRIKEIDRFIEILEEKNDTSFESFTPREVNSKNKEMIRELEFNFMIAYMKDQELEQKEKQELEQKKKNVSHEKSIEFEEQLSKINKVFQKANSALQFIDVDPMRAKIELRLLLQQLEKQIENLKNIY